MTQTHLIIPDTHAHFQHSQERADYLSSFIIDLKPDTVIHMGDSADMPSLSGYDKGKKSFQGRTYRADIDAHLEFQDRLWSPVVRRKKRLPRRVFLIGNHEDRISRAVEIQPELDGAIGLSDLDLERWYTDVVYYVGGTPGIINVDGIDYAHYFVSGVSGRPIGGEHSAYTLISKRLVSSTCAHSHTLDYCVRPNGNGRMVQGLVAGCYQDYTPDWAGTIGNQWWRGVIVKRSVENGSYDPQFISLDTLRRTYG